MYLCRFRVRGLGDFFAVVDFVEHFLCYVAGGAVIDDVAGTDADDAGRILEGEINVMDVEQDRDIHIFVNAGKVAHDDVGHDRIQRCDRLVGQDDRRILGQGAGQGYTLHLAAGQFVAAGICLVKDLDLVEVAPQARPPVCKLMDYGKFKYESAQKARESRRNQQQTVIKEQKLRPKIDPHDYETKKGHVSRFLGQGHKVKVTIMFRGREQSRPELGFRLLQRLAEDVSDLGFIEAKPKQDGRNMIMVLAPHKNNKKSKANAS